ncbi:hypothetical protein B808_1083 [Fructilactobacillus florum 8D]|uniref:Uncharacterized protein n=1 Tax=Fructilactobacillus florum 8D TaxID=1221538 RepID=W9EG69_9LACO|nr:hypothetical protein B807_951 [Fructilactobacillus florum 2F]ETO39975.1 hypothetical protein B808_1083 [Fructilactobacillus florum 8D]
MANHFINDLNTTNEENLWILNLGGTTKTSSLADEVFLFTNGG